MTADMMLVVTSNLRGWEGRKYLRGRLRNCTVGCNRGSPSGGVGKGAIVATLWPISTGVFSTREQRSGSGCRGLKEMLLHSDI